MTVEHDTTFRKLAKRNSWFIFVRDGNQAALKYRGKPGYRSKPLTITAKTTLEIKVGADITLTMTDGKVTVKCKQLAVEASDISLAGDAIGLDAKQGLALSGGSGVNINDGALEVTK